MKPLLFHARPLDVDTDTRVDCRAASALESEAYGLGGFSWSDAIAERPQVTIELMSLDLDGKVLPAKLTIALSTNQLPAGVNWQGLKWTGAPVSLFAVEDLDYPSRAVEFAGEVRSHRLDIDDGNIRLTCEVSTKALERNTLFATFTGAGGLTGEPEVRGTLMPAGFGNVDGIEPVWFDQTRWIGMIDGYKNTLAITRLMEGLSDFGPSQGNYPTYAALAAAIDNETIKPGQWATCIDEGLVGLGAPPAGTIMVNAQFGSNRLGQIIKDLVVIHARLDESFVDQASLNALDAAVPYDVHLFLKEQREVKAVIEALAASANAAPILLPNNTLAVTRAVTSAPVATLDRSGNQLPRVIDWASAEPVAPFWQIKVRAARPATVLTYDKVNYEDDIIDRGTYDPAKEYRQGNLVWKGGASYLYINVEAGAGHPLPVPPAQATAYWQQLTQAPTAGDLTYEDGTPIEDLQPAERDSTRGAPSGTPVGDRTADDVTDAIDQHETDIYSNAANIAAANTAIAAAEQEIDDLIATYGSTASAADSASAAEIARQAAEDAEALAEAARAAAVAAQNNAQQARDDAQLALSAAEDARDTAEQEALAASGSAGVAAGHATTATTKADEAADSASAASGSATAAQSSAGQASTSAGNAASSATNAAGSASQAATSANTAANARDDAQGHASAAATSEANAAASAGAAASSASAANTDKLAAQTARSGAETARNEAVTAQNNAAGSASTASTQATLSASSATRAKNYARNTGWLNFNGDFSVAQGWYTNNNQSTEWSADRFNTSASEGNVFQSNPGSINYVYGERIPVDPSRKYRLTFRAGTGGVATTRCYAGFISYDGAGAYIQGNDGTGNYPPTQGSELVPSGGYTTYTSGVVTGEGSARHTFPVGTASIALFLILNYDQAAGGYTNVAQAYIEDITESEEAGAQADAAATQASIATAKATEAGQSASSATNSANTATTKAGEASASAGQAATSASNAAGSATSASSFATLAAGYRDDAEDSADAAASSATIASTKAGEASTSASQAQSSAATATTKAGEAATSATNASTSETNASASAANAAAQAGIAANYSALAGSPIALTQNGDLSLGLSGLVSNYQGTALGSPDFTPAVVDGRTVVSSNTPSIRNDFGNVANFVPVVAGRRVRMTLTAKVTGSGAARMYCMLVLHDANKNYLTHISNAPDFLPADGWRTITHERTFDGSEGAFARMGLISNHGNNASITAIHIDKLYMEDITDSYSAAQSAAAAVTSASNAAASASGASTSASNAQTSANTATTKAGEAASSASAASASATSANSAASAASASQSLAANFATRAQNYAREEGWLNFNGAFTVPQGWYTYYNQATERPADRFKSSSSEGNVYQSDNSARQDIYSERIPIDPTRKYRLHFRAGTGGGSGARCYGGFVSYDGAGNYISGNNGTGNYPATNGSEVVPAAYTTYSSDIITGHGTGTLNFPPGTASIALYGILNYESDSGKWVNVSKFYIEDVTESENAASQAAIATSQAVIATAEAAAAKQTASLIASLNQGSINPNPTFLNWDAAVPDDYTAWGSVSPVKNTGINGATVADFTVTDQGQSAGLFIHQDLDEMRGIADGGKYVLELDARAISGTNWKGVAVGAWWYDNNGNFLSSDAVAPAVDALPGGAMAPFTSAYMHTWTKIVTAPAGARRVRLYVFGNYDNSITGGGYGSGSRRVQIHRAVIRPANVEEVRSNSAIPSLQASVVTNTAALATQASTLASLQTTVSSHGASITSYATAISGINGDLDALFAKAGVTIDVNGRITGWEANDDGSQGNFTVHSDNFVISKPGGGARTEFSNGNWRVYDSSGNLRVRIGVW